MSEATATATAERLSGREAAIARRQALSLHGKGALKAGSTAAPKSATEARMAARTRASEELHLTQPAVSTQIKQLEEEVGMPLFEQMGKKIFLTEVGKEVYAFSRAIAQQFRDIESVLDDMKGVKRGTLALTVTSTG